MHQRVLRGGFPQSAAVLDGVARLDHGQLGVDSRRVRGFLRSTGIGRGDRLAAALGDEAGFARLLGAALGAGVSLLPLDPMLGAAEALRLIRAAEVKAVFADREVLARWQLDRAAGPDLQLWPAAAGEKRTLLSKLRGSQSAAPAGTYPACVKGAEEVEAAADIAADQEALVLATSGSSSLPKLASITHGNLAAQAMTMSRHFAYGDRARVLNLSPVHHVDGVQALYTAMCTGTTLIRPGPFSIPRLPSVLDMLGRLSVTHALLNPTLLQLLLQFGEEELREAFGHDEFQLVISTAAPLSEEVWSRFEAASGTVVCNMYGMTEVGNVLFAGPDPESRRAGTVGLPVDCEIELRPLDGDDDSEGRRELMVRGPSVFPDYLGAPAAGEWFSTGDLAERTESGQIRLVGRKNATIIVGGRNLHPEEVDEAFKSLPSVVDVATVGFPDDTWGERVVSCVVSSDPAPDERELLAHAGRLLPAYKVPSTLILLDALPRTGSGKLDRETLLGLIRRQEGGCESADDASVERRVLAAASRAFRLEASEPTPELRPDTCEGWDSMAHLDLVVRLEEEFRVRFSPRDIMRIDCLAKAIELVEQKRGRDSLPERSA